MAVTPLGSIGISGSERYESFQFLYPFYNKRNLSFWPSNTVGMGFYHDLRKVTYTKSITGIVKNSLLEPVPNAIVLLFDRRDKSYITRTTSDENGRYTFNFLKESADFFVVVIDPNNSEDGAIHDRITPGSA